MKHRPKAIITKAGPKTTITCAAFSLLASALPCGAQVPTSGCPGQPMFSTAGFQANASLSISLLGDNAKTTYLSGIVVTGGGATAASAVSVDISGLSVGFRAFPFVVPLGAGVNASLVINFIPPMPASGQNTAITAVLPAFGAGNIGQGIMIFGCRL